MSLSNSERERYDRQLRVWGEEAQLKLKKAKVLIVGVGGLGSPVAIYLTAAGVGKLVLVDNGILELSNMNRQILYTTEDLGKPKVYIAAERLRKLNPNVEIEAIKAQLDEELADKLVKNVDVVVDALDNWETRLILNKACVENRKPLVHAGVEGWYGQLMTVIPGKTPCLNCIMPAPPPPRETPLPIVPTTPGLLGVLEANEVIKLIIEGKSSFEGRMLVYDGLRGEFSTIELKRNPNCPICSKLG